jgi:hypothetical protein
MIGKVYKIEVNNQIYIGSTISKLNDRETQHNYRLNQNIRTNKLYEECRKNEITKIICILLEEKEIENELEIRILEEEYITKLQPTLNSWSAYTGLTIEEYQKKYHNEYGKERYKNNRQKYTDYYVKNKDKVLERQGEKIKCPICNSVLRRDSLIKHKRSKKCLKV